MSHVATAWAIKASRGCGLNPAAKLVLFHLADRHNVDAGCFPSQERLVEDCEVSRSNLNLVLKTLEQKGLIRRHSERDGKTKRQKATRYKMAFEADFVPIDDGQEAAEQQPSLDLPDSEPCPKIGQGAVSKNRAEPCPISGPSRVQPVGQEPVREPGTEPFVSIGGDLELDRDFEAFWEAHPRPKDRDASYQRFREAVQAGEDPRAIIAGARKYAKEQAGNKLMYIYQSDNWLKQRRWREAPASGDPSPSDPEDAAKFWAGIVKAGGYFPPSAQKPSLLRDMLDRGLVDEAKLAEAGVRL
jgi:hypothetical protein